MDGTGAVILTASRWVRVSSAQSAAGRPGLPQQSFQRTCVSRHCPAKSGWVHAASSARISIAARRRPSRSRAMGPSMWALPITTLFAVRSPTLAGGLHFSAHKSADDFAGSNLERLQRRFERRGGRRLVLALRFRISTPGHRSPAQPQPGSSHRTGRRGGDIRRCPSRNPSDQPRPDNCRAAVESARSNERTQRRYCSAAP